MCDIYTDHCKICGKEIEMHLGDYDTIEEEINVFCNDCYKKIPKGNFVLWQDPSNRVFTAIESLTENAWDNKFHNHPNTAGIEIVCVVPAKTKKR